MPSIPDCTVARTHERGRPLRPADRTDIPGPIEMCEEYNATLRRNARRMSLVRTANGGARRLPSPIPDLLDPILLTFASARGMLVVGFEEIDGARYYQGWHITWQ